MKRVRSLKHLVQLADQRRAVISALGSRLTVFKRPNPASFVIQMQGRVIHWLLDAGLYVYEKKGAK
jgi:peroxiredoxin